jgi:DNA-binding CsgD family transcriptional regulator
MGVREFTRGRDRLLAADRAGLPVSLICDEIVRALHDVARFEFGALLTTDPETLLPSGGTVEGFSPTDCAPFWDNELLDPDFCKFADLARSVDPVATLVEATDGDLWRSPRYQKLYAAVPAGDELRLALVAGTSCLAVGAFVRVAEAGAFTPAELADVRHLAPVATTVLRRALGRVRPEATQRPPVVILLDGSGKVTSMSAGGAQVLDDLRIDGVDELQLPGVVQSAATKARWSRTTTTLTTRVRGRSGRWLRLHVTPMEGEVGAVALTVEPARADDLALILLDSYGLTARETEIVLLLCRGLTTKDIAAELIISAHTVRDHVKAIYDKAGVASRGELVAALFSNHALGRFDASVRHLGALPASGA